MLLVLNKLFFNDLTRVIFALAHQILAFFQYSPGLLLQTLQAPSCPSGKEGLFAFRRGAISLPPDEFN